MGCEIKNKAGDEKQLLKMKGRQEIKKKLGEAKFAFWKGSKRRPLSKYLTLSQMV